MAEVIVTIGTTTIIILANNPKLAAAALKPYFTPSMKIGMQLETLLAEEICSATKTQKFAPFNSQQVKCTIGNEELVACLKMEHARKTIDTTGGPVKSYVYHYQKKDTVPLSQHIMDELGNKFEPMDIEKQDVWIMTSAGEYKIVSTLSKKVGVSGLVFRVKLSGVGPHCFLKSPRDLKSSNYEAELAALRQFKDCKAVVNLVEPCDKLIILEAGTADLLTLAWKQPESKVKEAFRPLAEALQLMHRHGHMHDDLQLSNVVMFPGDVLKWIDIGGGAHSAKDNVSEFVEVMKGCILGQLSEEFTAVEKLVNNGTIATMDGLLESYFKA